VTDEAGLIEFELWRYKEAASSNFTTILENFLGLLMLQFNKGEILSMSEIKSYCCLKTLDVYILWEAA
jgi:hypothetical protein